MPANCPALNRTTTGGAGKTLCVWKTLASGSLGLRDGVCWRGSRWRTEALTRFWDSVALQSTPTRR